MESWTSVLSVTCEEDRLELSRLVFTELCCIYLQFQDLALHFSIKVHFLLLVAPI